MKKDIDYCIYCSSKLNLSDEHIIPYWLWWDLILWKASCDNCAKITCKLEWKLLRWHWWPYRLFLGHKSRRKNENIPNMIIKIIHDDNKISHVPLAMKSQSVAFVFELDKPTILHWIITTNPPYAPKVYMKYLSPLPTIFGINGNLYPLKKTDKIEIPINFNADDLFRFLAKIAHWYSYMYNQDILDEYYLPKIILGDTSTSMSYIWWAPEKYLLPWNEIHAVASEIINGFLIVYIQLFRSWWNPPPVYKVVVWKIKKSL